MTIDGIRLTESQRLAWLADDEHGQEPKIRATFRNDYPFALVTPSGEPIRAYPTFRSASLARTRLIQELGE